jgi:acyl carrier protein
MINKQQIKESVYSAMERVNELLLDENALPCAEETVLVGAGAQLDSMGFVNFVIALEEELAERAGLTLNITEELNSGDRAVPETMTAADFVNFIASRADEPRLAAQTDSSAN